MLKTVGIIGLGYVGLPTAMSLVSRGHQVIGFDISVPRVQSILKADVDLPEEKRELLKEQLEAGTLFVSNEPARLAEADTMIVCVPTPINEHRLPDLAALESARSIILDIIRPGQTVVLTSTTYVGCTRDMFGKAFEEKGLEVGKDVFVAFSPERINPGVLENDPLLTPRVLGGITEDCAQHALDILQDTAASVYTVSTPEAAEMTKLLENTFRAVNIAFINEFSDAAELYGVSISEVIDAAATKPYGFMKFTPGPGVGGHCIPCDPEYLLWGLKAEHAQAPITETVMNAIANRPLKVVQMVRNDLGELGVPITSAHIHVAGVAFKPNVADVRESPALLIIESLRKQGATITFSDEYVRSIRLEDGGTLEASSPEEARNADLVLIHTLHRGQTVESWKSYGVPVFDATFSTVAKHHAVV